MFTGLVEEIGTIKTITPIGGGRRITVSCLKVLDDLKIDDSISIGGVCQTVVSIADKTFEVEAVEETLRKTTFSSLRSGSRVNLERAIRLNDRLGGHIVQGHVDTTGTIQSIQRQASGVLVWVGFPEEFSRYVVPIGSVCIDGISLTVARVEAAKLMVSIIPHTWKVTTMSDSYVGTKVNLEFDILGKYVESLLKGSLSKVKETANRSILEQFLSQPGM